MNNDCSENMKLRNIDLNWMLISTFFVEIKLSILGDTKHSKSGNVPECLKSTNSKVDLLVLDIIELAPDILSK